jgi:hypothetical protein
VVSTALLVDIGVWGVKWFDVPGAEVTCPMVGGDKAVADHVCY